MADLWPNDIGITTQKAPLSILQEQASILGAKTKNLVGAEVQVGDSTRLRLLDLNKKIEKIDATLFEATKTGEEMASILNGKDAIAKDYSQLFVYDFYITAPVLNQYRFRIFTVAYDFKLYPVRFYLDKDIQDQIQTEMGSVWGRQGISANSEEELLGLLMQIFSSNKVRQIINALLVQSGGTN